MSDAWAGFAIRAAHVSATAADLQRRREQAELQRVQVQAQVRTWIDELGLQPWLHGQPDLVIPDAQVQALRKRIDDQFTGAQRRWAANFLSGGLERGRMERGWQVRVPPRVLVLRAPTPPLNAATFPALTQVGTLDNALQAYWLRCARARSAVRIEQVLLSAMWSSALIGEERIRHVATGLEQGQLRVSTDGQWAWVEWTDRAGNWQRLVFDPFTALLVLRWHAQRTEAPSPATPTTDSGGASPSRRIWRLLKRELYPKSIGLRNFTDFLRCAQARWHYRLPPFLAEFARGRVSNACLSPTAWWRLILGAPLQPGTVPGMSSGQRDVSHQSQSEPRANPSFVAAFDIRPLLRSAPQRATQVATKLRHFVDANASDPNRLDVVLATWMIDQVRPQGRKGNRLSSARELLARVDRRLLAVLGSQLPTDAATWNDALVAIVQSSGERQRRNVATALRMLDTSVRSRRGWDSPAPDLAADADTLVNAQLLTEREFRTVLGELQRRAAPRESMVVAILGYRCGLRRTEIRGLRWIDVQWTPQPLLFVRSHAGRALKRDSGRRVLVLPAFCPEGELDILRRAHAATQRLLDADLEVHDTALLLPDPSEPDQPLAETALFDPVTDAMRTVCGDETLRFHHLRHSVANHLLMQLMDESIDGAVRLLDGGAQIDAALIAARRRALVGVGNAQRPLLWAVAAFMGHATPQTTLGSYVHVLDALLDLCVQQDAAHPQSETTGWLVGATANHVNVQHHHWGVENTWRNHAALWIRKISKRLPQAMPTPQPVPAQPAATPANPTTAPRQAPSAVEHALLNITDALNLLASLSKDPFSPRALRHVTVAQAQRIHKWMVAWAQLRGNSPNRRGRAGLRDQPIVIGHLRLDRPRVFRQLSSKALRIFAQAWLDAWRSWWYEDHAAAEQALTLHWSAHDTDDHAVALTDVGEAVRWKSMLNSLLARTPNLPAVQWSWRHVPTSRSPIAEAEQHQQWCTLLGLNPLIVESVPARPFHPSRPAPPLGLLRVQDIDRGKTRPGSLLAALDAAAYVMTLSILTRAKSPSP